ncbi:hypothetical protein EJ08DRAFT_657411 [Tothia fuscella]|uniref:Uncharacterized protein n=1 Tax=Tothia fuscella TaxID=1048955 RepID=A0A9P4NXE9_9PEZI|nr:hypothetical protein EJ08DRAFT_657411 [Tothia fuscella]
MPSSRRLDRHREGSSPSPHPITQIQRRDHSVASTPMSTASSDSGYFDPRPPPPYTSNSDSQTLQKCRDLANEMKDIVEKVAHAKGVLRSEDPEGDVHDVMVELLALLLGDSKEDVEKMDREWGDYIKRKEERKGEWILDAWKFPRLPSLPRATRKREC